MNIKAFIFLGIIFLQSCSVQSLNAIYGKRYPLGQISKRTVVETSMDTLKKGAATIIFVNTVEKNTVFYEDSFKLYKMRRDLDSIHRASYIITTGITRAQENQQKCYEFYKGTSFVLTSVILTTGIWWLLNGR